MGTEFKIINTEYLFNVSQNNEFLKKIFSLFKEEVSLFRNKMPELLKDQKLNDLAELAHKAKSSVAILGMNKQSEAMKSLENDIRNNQSKETFSERIEQFLFDCQIAVSEIEILEKTL